MWGYAKLPRQREKGLLLQLCSSHYISVTCTTSKSTCIKSVYHTISAVIEWRLDSLASQTAFSSFIFGREENAVRLARLAVRPLDACKLVWRSQTAFSLYIAAPRPRCKRKKAVWLYRRDYLRLHTTNFIFVSETLWQWWCALVMCEIAAGNMRDFEGWLTNSLHFYVYIVCREIITSSPTYQ